MSLKKNAFSCLLWFVYMIMAVGALICAAVNLSTGYGYAVWTGFAGAIGVLILSGLLVLLVHKLTLKLAQAEEEGKNPLLLAESLAVVSLFAVGILFRIQGMAGASEESAYFEMAKVAEGQTIPQIVHGATYFYLQLLHLICLLFGNKIVAAIILQIVLQMGAFLFFYFGVRRIAGRIAAAVMLVFAMFSPGMRGETLLLSPDLLFLFLFSIVFFIAAGLAGKKNPVKYCLTGILIAVVCYFDISGSVLLLFACGMAFFTEASPDRIQENAMTEKLAKICLCLVCFCLGFLAVTAIDALLCGKNVFGVLSAWFQLYRPEGFLLPFILSQGGIAWEAVLAVCCLTLGIFSFWCRKGEEIFSLWVLMTVLLGAEQCFGIVTEAVDGRLLFYFLITVMAGIAVQEMFALPVLRETVQTKEDLVIQDLEAEEEPMQEIPAQEASRAEEPAGETAEAVQEAPEPVPVRFLENPLPLPRKHEKRVMDYQVKLPERDDFDFPVAENDDFDI